MSPYDWSKPLQRELEEGSAAGGRCLAGGCSSLPLLVPLVYTRVLVGGTSSSTCAELKSCVIECDNQESNNINNPFLCSTWQMISFSWGNMIICHAWQLCWLAQAPQHWAAVSEGVAAVWNELLSRLPTSRWLEATVHLAVGHQGVCVREAQVMISYPACCFC